MTTLRFSAHFEDDPEIHCGNCAAWIAVPSETVIGQLAFAKEMITKEAAWAREMNRLYANARDIYFDPGQARVFKRLYEDLEAWLKENP